LETVKSKCKIDVWNYVGIIWKGGAGKVDMLRREEN
jgi:hypothetical protein